MTSSVAAVDLGTNSLRLLILDAHGAMVRRETRIVRLGEGVDASGRITPTALERVGRVLREYRDLLDRVDVGPVRMVATAAARAAENTDDLRAVVERDLRGHLDVISGDDEASLSFAGAVRALRSRGVLAAGDTLVVDIGGGSTEFVRGDRSATHARSVDVGSVRLTERVLRADPPTPGQVTHATVLIDAALDEAFGTVPVEGAGNVVGVAGTVTTLTAIALGLDRYDSATVDGAALPIGEVRDVCRCVLAMTGAKRMALGIPYGRADVIGAGALIWDRILRRISQDSTLTRTITSEADILDGVAHALLTSR